MPLLSYLNNSLSGLSILLLLFNFQHTYSQNTFLVSGKVTDLITGDPLAFARVKLIKNNSSVTTDIDGNFSMISALGKEDSLVISFIGYKSYRIDLKKINFGTPLTDE